MAAGQCATEREKLAGKESWQGRFRLRPLRAGAADYALEGDRQRCGHRGPGTIIRFATLRAADYAPWPAGGPPKVAPKFETTELAEPRDLPGLLYIKPNQIEGSRLMLDSGSMDPTRDPTRESSSVAERAF